MRIATLLFAAALLVPAAAAQDVLVERDGDEVTVTRPDGTVERFTIDEEAELRVRSKNGPLSIEDGDGVSARGFELRREGGPGGFAFRVRPGGEPFGEAFDVERFMEDLDIELGADSVAERVLRFHRGSGVLDGGRDGFLPWPGFAGQGVDPATRRQIVEGERESRRLARALRSAESDDRARIASELRETLERTFALKQEARRERLEVLGEEADRLHNDITELEEEVEAREQARDEIIERRQRELSGDDDALDW